MRLAISLLLLSVSLGTAVLAAGCAAEAAPTPATAAPTVAPTATAQPTPVPPTPQPTAVPPSPTPAPPPQPAPPPPQPTVGVPVRVEIPAVGVSASVYGLGLVAGGALDAPKNPDTLGWYQDGTRPGERGNALIDGHVDWAGKIRAFWYLQKLRPGDRVFVTDSDGRRLEFAVEWSKWYAAEAPVDELFRQSDEPVLTLITCGGQFDKASHAYLSRLAVRARLV